MMMMKTKFYDTCSLIANAQYLFEKEDEQFVISSITLEELEEIKTSKNKSNDIKIAVRHLLHELDKHIGDYEVCIFKESMLCPIHEENLSINNDMKILATAIFYNTNIYPNLTFITNDLALKTIARLFFDDIQIESIEEKQDDYKGYRIIQFNDDKETEFFYSNYRISSIYPDILVNEYIILKNPEGEIIDRLVYTKEGYRNISFEIFDSKEFGRIRPLDIQQQLAADSFTHNKLTMIRGKAGSGKSMLALGYLFNQLEKNHIDKIIIFCNTIAAKGAAKLGYLPGSREEKLLDSQIGNFLSSKLGSKMEVERLIENEDLILLPMADIRGYDTTGMRAGIYITEAQNMDIPLMKLALQRIGEDSICIIDGDDKAQVDDETFAGDNNGMKRVSKVFRNHSIYGEITLDQIHRSELAKIAEDL